MKSLFVLLCFCSLIQEFLCCRSILIFHLVCIKPKFYYENSLCPFVDLPYQFSSLLILFKKLPFFLTKFCGKFFCLKNLLKRRMKKKKKTKEKWFLTKISVIFFVYFWLQLTRKKCFCSKIIPSENSNSTKRLSFVGNNFF